MNAAIEEFISKKRIAVVGVSRNARKFGNYVNKELKVNGCETFPVHPDEIEIDGVKCAPNLTAVKGNIDGVFISIKSEKAMKVLEEAAAIGVKNVWLQRGGETPELIGAAERLGLQMVSKKCILMYAQPVRSIHKFHRFLAKLFGTL